MAGQFGTQTEVMGTASNHVVEVNAQIQQQLAALRAQLAPLEGTWRGQASLSFHRLMVRWNEDAQRIGRALEAIGTDIAVSGRDYDATEQANAQSVTQISQALS